MGNITLETANFSEQLGIYDFFNVIISGAVFVFSLCAINSNFNSLIFEDITPIKGLGIVLFIYIIGLILQGVSAFVDKRILGYYTGMNRSIIKDSFDENGKKKPTNDIIDNSLLIEQYRKHADAVLGDLGGVDKKSDLVRYNNDEVNGFFFSVCQYYVAVNGKDRKVEKMRALYSMSKTLGVCFGLLTFITILFLPDNIFGKSFEDACNIDKIVVFIFAGMSVFFIWRAKEIMRRFLLVLLGTYDAIIRLENKERQSEGGSIGGKGGYQNAEAKRKTQ